MHVLNDSVLLSSVKLGECGVLIISKIYDTFSGYPINYCSSHTKMFVISIFTPTLNHKR